jgi:hypothetical protein
LAEQKPPARQFGLAFDNVARLCIPAVAWSIATMKQRLLPPAAALALLLATSAHAQPTPNVEPDATLTPGEIASTDTAVVCQRGYSKAVRRTMPRGLRASVYRRYGIGRDDHRFVIDHRVPLGLGGADTAANMWPEPQAGDLNSNVKDGLEAELRRRVCYDHTMALEAAQQVFLGDWVAAWRAFGKPAPLHVAE